VHHMVRLFTSHALHQYQFTLVGDRGTWAYGTCPRLLCSTAQQVASLPPTDLKFIALLLAPLRHQGGDKQQYKTHLFDTDFRF